MKIRLALAFSLVFILATTIMVSHVALANNPSEFRKQTGGGLFTAWDVVNNPIGNKVTFSFTAQALEPSPENNGYVSAKGKFQLIDHTEKTRIHGTIDYLYYVPSEPWWSMWEGECSIDGTDGYYFVLSVLDEDEAPYDGDWLWIAIREETSHSTVYNWWLERLQGNIKTH